MTDAAGRLGRLIDGRRPPGVYRVDGSGALPGTLAAAARPRGLAAWVLDTAGAPSKAAFLDRCAHALALPAWFGRNWDALTDALRDLRAPAGTGALVLWVHAGALEPEVLDVALDVFAGRTAVAPPFSVVLLDGPERASLGAL